MQNNSGNNQLLETLMSKLGPQDQERVKSLLSDKEACEKILSSREAQDLIRQFKGGK
ncbi:hypothetical protein [Caproicibacter fermentans]|uniref:Uncharacterized protein n=1 Tax=Caproicibacter fermentans TaxID=2576756 RepID=A0A7G8T7H8_9FIRM|nr:hypothetical protein [Caproicibacter fermentans]QNK39569.1 hypothetical protein HCR03_12565 [Caproicibacter fermentans]